MEQAICQRVESEKQGLQELMPRPVTGLKQGGTPATRHGERQSLINKPNEPGTHCIGIDTDVWGAIGMPGEFRVRVQREKNRGEEDMPTRMGRLKSTMRGGLMAWAFKSEKPLLNLVGVRGFEPPTLRPERSALPSCATHRCLQGENLPKAPT